MGRLTVKRIYEAPSEDDGHRFLVDRLWPRGMSKDRAALEGWEKGVAPSPELRKLFHAGSLGFDEFAAAYQTELDASEAAADFARRCEELLAHDNVTLVYAARSEDNHAKVLLHWLQDRIGSYADEGAPCSER